MNNQIDQLPNGDFRVREQCIECGKPADVIRHTQFAGDHPYCKEHGMEKEDYSVDDSYTYWTEISNGH